LKKDLKVLESDLLQPLDVQFLSSHIHNNWPWRLAFSTLDQGKSWTAFCSCLNNLQESIIVIKDHQGHVFGGFASSPWKKSPGFYGNSSCFLFTCFPAQNIYHASGYNQNFQYLAFDYKSLPNGLGFGGQINYFALFLSQDFENGMCRSEPFSSTFYNPMLSSCADFKIAEVEVWSVRDIEKDDRLLSKEDAKKSILDGNSIESSILEMAGKTMHSKNLTNPPREDEPI